MTNTGSQCNLILKIFNIVEIAVYPFRIGMQNYLAILQWRKWIFFKLEEVIFRKWVPTCVSDSSRRAARPSWRSESERRTWWRDSCGWTDLALVHSAALIRSFNLPSQSFQSDRTLFLLLCRSSQLHCHSSLAVYQFRNSRHLKIRENRWEVAKKRRAKWHLWKSIAECQ